MNFRKLLQKAKNGDKDAVEELIYMYQPLISKMSFIDDAFDEDLYQEQLIRFLHCIDTFLESFENASEE